VHTNQLKKAYAKFRVSRFPIPQVIPFLVIM